MKQPPWILILCCVQLAAATPEVLYGDHLLVAAKKFAPANEGIIRGDEQRSTLSDDDALLKEVIQRLLVDYPEYSDAHFGEGDFTDRDQPEYNSPQYGTAQDDEENPFIVDELSHEESREELSEMKGFHAAAVSQEHAQSIHKENVNVVTMGLMLAIVAIAATGFLIAGVACYVKYRRSTTATAHSEYGVFGAGGITSPRGSGKTSDRTLTNSAALYHFEQQKQQIVMGEKAGEIIHDDLSSDSEDEDNDDTVYECPGLAATGELQVTNPLFSATPEKP